MFTGPHSHWRPRKHTLALDREYPRTALTPARLPSGTVPIQVLMERQEQGQQLRGRGRRWQGYGTSSTAATGQVQKRGDEMEVRRHLPGVPEGATKRTRGEAPIMHQLVKVK